MYQLGTKLVPCWYQLGTKLGPWAAEGGGAPRSNQNNSMTNDVPILHLQRIEIIDREAGTHVVLRKSESD